jgi:hypothetical protein
VRWDARDPLAAEEGVRKLLRINRQLVVSSLFGA